MAHTTGPYKSVVKFSADETLPSKTEIIQGNWASGIYRSTDISQSSISLPTNSLTKRVEGLGMAGSVAVPVSLVSFHEALIEASKLLIIPRLPPYDQGLVEYQYRNALSKKKAAVTLLADIEAECEDYEGLMCDHIGETATERFLAANYIVDDTDTVKGKYREAVSKLTIRDFGISYDRP